nr:uncharacterized protein CTRU02_08233 [Colletotrichum truncatum]KAF6790104.1 hypothetical protein CTRU02_08233 [Colletotrichum truncatum]
MSLALFFQNNVVLPIILLCYDPSDALNRPTGSGGYDRTYVRRITGTRVNLSARKNYVTSHVTIDQSGQSRQSRRATL